ncbi:hypothetical protein ACFL1B_04305 [Nanoarchaeota archaeon]
MATTITVRESTRKKLELLKEKEKARTFDELLDNIATKKLKLPKSLSGSVQFLDKQDIREHMDRF